MVLDWKRLQRLNTNAENLDLHLGAENRRGIKRHFGGIWGNVDADCRLLDNSVELIFIFIGVIFISCFCKMLPSFQEMLAEVLTGKVLHYHHLIFKCLNQKKESGVCVCVRSICMGIYEERTIKQM